MIYDSEAGDFSIVLTGDTMLSRRLTPFTEAPYLAIKDILQSADAAFTNLEGTVRAPADGTQDPTDGTPMTIPPALLGQAYASGADGLEQDYVAAHAWLNLAGAAGHAEAAETREVIAALMTPEQIAEAQARARDLHAAILARTPRTQQTVRGSE